MAFFYSEAKKESDDEDDMFGRRKANLQQAGKSEDIYINEIRKLLYFVNFTVDLTVRSIWFEFFNEKELKKLKKL